MTLFRRSAPVHDFTAPAGIDPCSERGCEQHTAVPCAYRDKRGRTCRWTLCPAHWSLVGGVVYCRRHSSTITALGASARGGALPEVDDRGPSLVNFVAESIADRVVALLEGVALPGERVSREPQVTVIYDQNRRRRWERSWKLLDDTGVNIKVSLQVPEDGAGDALVDARVGSGVVARGVPPWITRRRLGQSVAPEVDRDQRELYATFMLDHLSAGVHRQRAIDRAALPVA